MSDASKDRREKDKEFVKYAATVTKRLEMANRKSLTFTEDLLKKQRKELGVTDDESDIDNPDAKKKEPPKFGQEPYTRKALAIAGDLVQYGKK